MKVTLAQSWCCIVCRSGPLEDREKPTSSLSLVAMIKGKLNVEKFVQVVHEQYILEVFSLRNNSPGTLDTTGSDRKEDFESMRPFILPDVPHIKSLNVDEIFFICHGSNVILG